MYERKESGNCGVYYAAGVPVLGARIGGIPEIIVDGKTGYLFDSGNKDMLVQIIRDSDILEQNKYWNMCSNALGFAKEHFNRGKYYPKLMVFFEKIKKTENGK